MRSLTSLQRLFTSLRKSTRNVTALRVLATHRHALPAIRKPSAQIMSGLVPEVKSPASQLAQRSLFANEAMDSATNDDHLEIGQEFAAAARPGEDVTTDDQELDPKTNFDCPHCDKFYKTKKSLSVRLILIYVQNLLTTSQRHLSSTDNACAKQRLVQAQFKPRWACSRCGKDCTTSQSVEASHGIVLSGLSLTPILAPYS
jgi:transcription elongation factor Elf1